jgi:hypothetical protein
MIMFDHSECGNGGARAELMSEDFANLRSRAKILGTIEIKRKIPSGQRVREGKRDASSELRVH